MTDPEIDSELDGGPIHGLWNPAVQLALGKRLVFLRLTLGRYDLEEAVATLRDTLVAAGVTDFGVYELFGVYDILVRCWIDNTNTTSAVAAQVRQDLQQHHLSLLEYFEVTQIEAHFLWNDWDLLDDAASGSIKTICEKPSDTALKAITDSGNPHSLDPELLLSQNAFRPLTYQQDFTRIFLFVTPPPGLVMGNAVEMHETAVRKAVFEAIGSERLDLSLYYSDSSRMGSFLITGHVHLSDLYGPIRELTHTVVANPLTAATGIRTVTLISSSPYPIDWLQSASPALEREARTVAGPARGIIESRGNGPETSGLGLLVESQYLEVKASLAIEVDRLANTGEASKLTHLSKGDGREASIAKAVVGFLNARVDGQIVIGLYEVDRLNRLGKGAERFAKLPQIDGFVVLGIDIETEARSWSEEQWLNHLHNTLDQLVDPKPLALVDTEIRSVAGRRLAFVSVAGSDVPDGDWYYATEREKETFFVRMGPHTRPLSASSADRYKSVQARSRPSGRRRVEDEQ